MKYDFDTVIDRQGTHAVKIDGMKEIWGRTNLIPLWVADMDFATPDFIREAVARRCAHPILGYTCKPEEYYHAIRKWMKTRYQMEVDDTQITYVPGIVAGLGIAIHALTAPGDKIMIMTPVYPPFSWLVTRNNRQLVTCPLRETENGYRMNLERLQREIKGIRLLILCNPHNPAGIVWTQEELQLLARICAEENVIVVSDEIHADLTLPPHRHLPFAMVSDNAKYNSITFMAPSKTFNMPGVSASHAITFNEGIREKLNNYIESSELGNGHVFAFPAVEVAYNQGEEWLSECLSYIQGNIEYTLSFCQEHLPHIKPVRPMASYLIWLDCWAMNLSQERLKSFFADQAGLALNDGETFGKEGIGFMRMNIGCPRSTLEKALRQLKTAYDRLY